MALVTLATAGCGGSVLGDVDASATDGSAAESSAPRATTHSGVYIVPPQADVRTYDVDELHWIVVGEEVALSYNLPRMLVGDRIRIALSGTLDPAHAVAELTGPAGTARCDVRPSDLSLLRCDERFNTIVPDFERVREAAIELDPQRVDERVGVAEYFSNEPIGVLEVGAQLRDGTVGCRVSAPACPQGTTCHVEAGDLGLCTSTP